MSRLSVFCPIHGLIELTPLTLRILNTPEMQRLRDLKQLGSTYFVFPSATHTRLEHSIGVSYLASKMGRKLQKIHPSLKITDRFIELLGIAGLVHDIGHGPFSHLYDNYVKDEEEPEHEERGLVMFQEICERERLSLTKDEFNEICKMINPTGDDVYNWRYQIVANKSCQIDVDKIDYIQRDSYHLGIPHTGEINRLLQLIRINKTDRGDELTWDYKVEFDIYSLFSNRYRLHRQVYKHHTISAFDYVVTEIMKNIKETGYSKIPLYKQTDAIVTQYCYNHPDDPLSKAIMKREHPHLYKQLVILDSSSESYRGFKEIDDGIVIDDVKIGFVSGSGNNPLKNVNYFNGKMETYKVMKGKSSFIIPEEYQEILVRMYFTKEGVDKDRLEEQWQKVEKMYSDLTTHQCNS